MVTLGVCVFRESRGVTGCPWKPRSRQTAWLCGSVGKTPPRHGKGPKTQAGANGGKHKAAASGDSATLFGGFVHMQMWETVPKWDRLLFPYWFFYFVCRAYLNCFYFFKQCVHCLSMSMYVCICFFSWFYCVFGLITACFYFVVLCSTRIVSNLAQLSRSQCQSAEISETSAAVRLDGPTD